MVQFLALTAHKVLAGPGHGGTNGREDPAEGRNEKLNVQH